MVLKRNKTVLLIVIGMIIAVYGSIAVAPFMYWLVTLIGSYWYITLPCFIAFSLTYQIRIRRKYYKLTYLKLDSEKMREKFENQYEYKAIQENKLSRKYIKWLMKDVPRKLYMPYTGISELISVVVAVIILTLIGLIVLSVVESTPLI